MTISRRGFLQGVGVGVLAAGSAKAAGHKRFEGYDGGFGLLHDTNLCVGCRSCEAACNEVNGNPSPEAPIGDKKIFESVRRTTEDQFTVVNRYVEAQGEKPPVYRKHQCMHCNEPCCASVCFVQAFRKTPEGPVLYDPDVCVGCRYCVMACPYYALSYEYDKPFDPKVVRCTMCYPRIKEEGKNPGCADACPTGAIVFGPRDELIKLARKRIAKQPDRYIDHIYGEHEFGGTSWMIIGGTSFKKLDLHEGATHTSIPEMGASFLSVVPLVVTIYPGLLAGFYAWSKRKEKLSNREKDTAVADAVARANEAAAKKAQAATERAKQDKNKAVEQAVKQAVKQALAEASKKEEPK